MADELNKKKPDLGAGGSSPASSPAPKANPNPAPKVDAPKQAAPKQTNPFKANSMPGFEGMGKSWDKMMGSAQKVIDNNKQQPKADPVRQKIINQGFAPKDWKKSAIDDIDKLGSTNVGVGNGKAVDAYKHNNKFYARTYADKEGGAPSEDDMSDILFKGADGNDIDGFDTFEELMEALHKDGYPVDDQLRGQPHANPETGRDAEQPKQFSSKKTEQDLRNFENSHPFEVLYDYDENGNRNGYELKFKEPADQKEYDDMLNEVYPIEDIAEDQPQQPAWNKENDPGSGVVTKELTDWVRSYLTEQVGEDYANTIAANLHKDHNQADYFRKLMKEDWEKKNGGK